MPETQRLLELALRGLEAEQARINKEIEEVQSQINGRKNGRASPITVRRERKRRAMSAEARRSITDAMKRSHAQRRATVSSPQIRARRGGITAAGRKKLSEMMKARWAARKKAVAKK